MPPQLSGSLESHRVGRLVHIYHFSLTRSPECLTPLWRGLFFFTSPLHLNYRISSPNISVITSLYQKLTQGQQEI